MHVFITGTGSGIGKTLAESFLKKGIRVTGISRNKTIDHKLFEFIQADLTNELVRDQFSFPQSDDNDVVLINNAGTLGTIGPFLELSKEDIRRTFRLNVEALMVLSMEFINSFHKKKRTLIHIGSGAANRSIKGWSNYCASKAAVHHFNQVLNDELNYFGQSEKIRSIVVSPGVVDTPMQEKIRNTDVQKFPDVKSFIELKETNNLVPPEEVSHKIEHIIKTSEELPNIIELRDYNIE